MDFALDHFAWTLWKRLVISVNIVLPILDSHLESDLKGMPFFLLEMALYLTESKNKIKKHKFISLVPWLEPTMIYCDIVC